jgi:hypothetical protein
MIFEADFAQKYLLFQTVKTCEFIRMLLVMAIWLVLLLNFDLQGFGWGFVSENWECHA